MKIKLKEQRSYTTTTPVMCLKLLDWCMAEVFISEKVTLKHIA